jgi:ribosome recycling factor
VQAPGFRLMSTLEKKERGDEARYFAQQEAARLAEMKAKVEAIMASDDDNVKETLEEVLTAKADDSMVAQYGLNDWKFALPIGMVAAIPVLGNEWLVLGAETQLVAVFILFCSTAFWLVGGMVAMVLDATSDAVREAMRKVDESMLVDIKHSIAQNEKVLDMESDISSVHALVDDMSVVKADALNYQAEHQYRDDIVKKLESLVAIEGAAVQNIRNRMLDAVRADVSAKFSTDAKLKAAALNQAMAVLAGGKSGKRGKDVVGEAYAASLAKYRDDYAKMKPGSDEILNQLEKDVAAAVAAPQVSATGGNVYETHNVTA